jgi:hypothetical protein
LFWGEQDSKTTTLVYYWWIYENDKGCRATS